MIEQQPLNELAPFETAEAIIDNMVVQTIMFADGSTLNTASGGSVPPGSLVDGGTY
jgi:hypothetical protein